MTETLAHGYSSDSSQRVLSYEYQHALVMMIFITFSIFVHCTKVTSTSEFKVKMLTLNVEVPHIRGPAWLYCRADSYPYHTCYCSY